jgi:hypothetical protein
MHSWQKSWFINTKQQSAPAVFRQMGNGRGAVQAGITKRRRMGAAFYQRHGAAWDLVRGAALRPTHGKLRARAMISAKQAQPDRVAMKAPAGIIIHTGKARADFRLLRDGGKEATQQQHI